MSILRRITNLFHRSKLDQEIEAELRSHIEMRRADNIAAGMSTGEARRDALLRFGNRAVLKELVTAADAHMFLASAWQYLCYGLRMLRKNPGVTSTVVLNLALGIGVNTAMFSLLNGWLLRPLPVPSPEQIAVLASQQKEGSNGNFSYPDFLDFQRGTDSFSSLFGYAFGIGGLSADGDAREIGYISVTGNYFSALGVKPALGRLFLPGEGKNRARSFWLFLDIPSGKTNLPVIRMS